MLKLPKIEKIAESYSAIADDRIKLFDNFAIVKSSNKEKEYLIKWNDNLYYSNDNSTYWQNIIGYPIIAVLMLNNKLSLNKNILKYFKDVNWNKLNKMNNKNYTASLNKVLENVSNDDKILIFNEMNKVLEEIKNLNIELTRKKNIV